MRLTTSAIVFFLTAAAASAGSARLSEPALKLPGTGTGGMTVALTLDACGGGTDMRILSALVDNNIPATVFVTGIWLKRNPEAIKILKSRPDLFAIENHGARHIPAVDVPMDVYGLHSAGSAAAVSREVLDGDQAITQAGFPKSRWFRGATAKYTSSAMKQIEGLGFHVAGFSLNADGGSLLGAAATQKRVESARNGDVLIGHINQPKHAAGSGLVKGLLALKARGATFVRLPDTAHGN